MIAPAANYPGRVVLTAKRLFFVPTGLNRPRTRLDERGDGNAAGADTDDDDGDDDLKKWPRRERSMAASRSRGMEENIREGGGLFFFRCVVGRCGIPPLWMEGVDSECAPSCPRHHLALFSRLFSASPRALLSALFGITSRAGQVEPSIPGGGLPPPLSASGYRA
jgi:hypothetical protein